MSRAIVWRSTRSPTGSAVSSPSGSGARPSLRLGLELLPPAGVASAAPAATAIPHRVSVTLDFPLAPPSAARRKLPVEQDLKPDSDHLWAEFEFASLSERDLSIAP